MRAARPEKQSRAEQSSVDTALRYGMRDFVEFFLWAWEDGCLVGGCVWRVCRVVGNLIRTRGRGGSSVDVGFGEGPRSGNRSLQYTVTDLFSGEGVFC